MNHPTARLLAKAALPIDAHPQHLSGGMMGEVYRCGAWVVKTHASPPEGLFPAEAKGLDALACAGMTTPAVRYVDEGGVVMEYLAPGSPNPKGLATQIARLHGISASTYGWSAPVFLGRFRLPESIDSTDWVAFWTTYRIRPLIAATAPTLGPLASRLESLLEGYTPPMEGPVLLHGDLWNGNVLMTDRGAALIDPSVWYGERAVDLSMMRLFGGFSSRFWSIYRDLRPISPAVEEAIPYYQLYYLLVHVHFFGAGYCRGVDEVLRGYGY